MLRNLAEGDAEVVGVTLRLWGGESDSGCCSVADVDDARRVADQLGIDHHVFNFGPDFDRAVVGPYVDALARRIASFPARAIAEAKVVISATASGDIESALLNEQRAFDRLMADPSSERIPRMRRFLELGCQTPQGERTIGADCTKLAQDR